MFLVEQNAFHALKLAHRGYVMVNGAITLSGTGTGAAGAAGGARGLSRRRQALRTSDGLLDPGIPVRRALARRLLLVTVLMGGGAAWLAGRAIAATWRPGGMVALYMLVLGVAVRFMPLRVVRRHVAVAALLSGRLRGLLAFGAARLPRRRGCSQMVTQYGWINERAGPFSWRRRDDTAAAEKPKSG